RRELGGEKIDMVEWSPDPVTFVSRALSPAKVSSVTVGEADGEGAQGSVLVIVPDSQLSLAIGKRGQNARLAAKLTGLRVDIKSESEVEDEQRREEEEFARGREALMAFPGVGPQLVAALSEAGLFSPARIVRGGLAALAEVPGVGEQRATEVLEAARAWMAEHEALAAAGGDAGSGEHEATSGHEGEPDASGGDSPVGASPSPES